MLVTAITRRFVRRSALAILAITTATTAHTSQQTPVLLQITAPADGTIVAPGQTLAVTVSSPANVAFSSVGVIGERPLGLTDIATAVPAQFSIVIPANIAPRIYELTAMGTTASGQDVESEPIEIDVERSDMPTSLSALLPRIIFQAQGETSPITLVAKFPDGSAPDVTESSRVSYSSSNAAVASVDETGMVTAVGAGQATVTATYRLGPQEVRFAIPVTVPRPVLQVNPAALDFGDQNIGTTASRDLRLTNIGTQPLTIVGVAAAGDFAASDDCESSSPLRAGDACTISVTFAPEDIGPSPGSVTVFHDAAVLPDSFPVTGNALGRPTTATMVASSASPSVYGQAVTLTASVSTSANGTPSGTVTFSDGDTLLATAPLVAGQATYSTSSFSVGAHAIETAYSGDATFQSSAAGLTQTVARASTSGIVSASANPVVLHSGVTFRASVSVVAPGGGTPTGQVTFTSGSTPLAAVPLSASDDAQFAVTTSEVGALTIAAVYGGDANFEGSSSPAIVEHVEYEPAGTLCDGEAGHQVLPPLRPSDAVTFQRGRTVPVKFRVCDANGVSMNPPAVVSDFYEIRDDGAGRAAVRSTTPQSAFRWDATDRQWIFNVDTSALTSGVHRFAIALNDGTEIAFAFALK
jgi:hypothetical protein